MKHFITAIHRYNKPARGLLPMLIRNAVYVIMRFVRRFNRRDFHGYTPTSPTNPDDTLFGHLIRTYAPGNSFADICCMWTMHGSVAYYAESKGATKVTAFDAMDPTPEFLQTRQQKNSSVRFVQGNIDTIDLAATVGKHDVVWCTGLLYHTPDPFGVIGKLLSIADKYAIIGSKTLPDLPGISNTAIFLPGLSELERSKLMPFWGSPVHKPFGLRPAWDYEWWWLLSGSAIASMIETFPGWKVSSIYHRARHGTNDNCVVVAERIMSAH